MPPFLLRTAVSLYLLVFGDRLTSVFGVLRVAAPKCMVHNGAN